MCEATGMLHDIWNTSVVQLEEQEKQVVKIGERIEKEVPVLLLFLPLHNIMVLCISDNVHLLLFHWAAPS